MCGRFASTLTADVLADIFRAVRGDGEGHDAEAYGPALPPSWNKAPSQSALVVRFNPRTGRRHLDALRWGLIPHWTADIKKARQAINARSETAEASPLFRSAVRSRRCLVPMDAFYEWRRGPHGKQPYATARQDAEVMAMAGIWESWRDLNGGILRSFALLTTRANYAVAPIHDRMPVMVEEADWPTWLGEDEQNWRDLLRPSVALLKIWCVSTRVNSPRNDGPDLLLMSSMAESSSDGGSPQPSG